ncbi:MAG TPA: hypothetical protein VFV67_23885 [Actinophytocola sp.]|uniref:hypothetical protein n=1 Tax=Actinophytocola sp. TaxID=1872138 RepID=UPI002DBC2586|nr:hypothetical protein [Actinophytocola sp.]HEU5473699.1 hypothetical protein [Actinophytocola sp.]
MAWSLPAVPAGAADEFGGVVGQAGQHAGVGVGGEHVFVKAVIGATGGLKFVRLDDMITKCYW